MAEPTGAADAQRMRLTIQEWLMEEGWRIGTHTAPDALWLLTGQDERNRPVLVVQPMDRRDQILIFAALVVAPEQQALYSSLPQRERAEIIFELRQALILLDLNYAGVGEPLERIEIMERIYYDGLTKDAFLRRVSRLRNGAILVRNIIARRLNVPPPPQEEPKRMGFPTPPTP